MYSKSLNTNPLIPRPFQNLTTSKNFSIVLSEFQLRGTSWVDWSTETYALTSLSYLAPNGVSSFDLLKSTKVPNFKSDSCLANVYQLWDCLIPPILSSMNNLILCFLAWDITNWSPFISPSSGDTSVNDWNLLSELDDNTSCKITASTPR